ncbi:hypothetical protein BD414DRAFT_489357 [Trametes punicea]|nr:hypothetical protein BD414DRAFT_489357 [Trametes punicea]
MMPIPDGPRSPCTRGRPLPAVTRTRAVLPNSVFHKMGTQSTMHLVVLLRLSAAVMRSAWRAVSPAQLPVLSCHDSTSCLPVRSLYGEAGLPPSLRRIWSEFAIQIQARKKGSKQLTEKRDASGEPHILSGASSKLKRCPLRPSRLKVSYPPLCGGQASAGKAHQGRDPASLLAVAQPRGSCFWNALCPICGSNARSQLTVLSCPEVTSSGHGARVHFRSQPYRETRVP